VKHHLGDPTSPDPGDHILRKIRSFSHVELAYVPTNASGMNRIEAQFQALRYYTLSTAPTAAHIRSRTR
jgi:hypothetical protein